MGLPQTPDQRPAAPRTDRRAFLLGVGATFLAACAGKANTEEVATRAGNAAEPSTGPGSTGSGSTALSASSPSQSEPATGSADLTPLVPAQFLALPICTVLPSATAGPFPTLEQLDRRDITEDYPGHPLRLGLRVVDSACEPIAGSEVELWHCDASGDYSSYDDGGSGKDEGDGTTFLRGFQTADDDGITEFQTIYPGWYEGRAVHIHVRVSVGGKEILTSQLYFDEDYTEAIYEAGEYAQFGPPDTSIADDGLAGDTSVDGSLISLSAAVTYRGSGTLGLVNLGVRT